MVLRHREEDGLENTHKAPTVKQGLGERLGGGRLEWKESSEVKARLPQGCSFFSCFSFGCIRAPSLLPDPEEPRALPKLHLPKKHPSTAAASRLSPLQPPGSALDGNCVRSHLSYPTMQLIQFKLPFFF